MSAIASQSDDLSGVGAADAVMAGVRARGVISVSSAMRDGKSVRDHVREEGSLRIRFPREEAAGLNAVVVNTGGGMTGGDVFSISATAGEDSTLTVTTSAAEKFYRSLGAVADIYVTLKVQRNAVLAWLPQEAILFDGSRVVRRYEVEIDQSAKALLCDINCVGRSAMGETVRDLKLQDQWRIKIGGQLCLADFTRIDGNASDILARPTSAAGASSFASLIYAGPDTSSASQMIGDIISGRDDVTGATGLVNGISITRFVSKDLAALRSAVAACARVIHGEAMPRSWET